MCNQYYCNMIINRKKQLHKSSLKADLNLKTIFFIIFIFCVKWLQGVICYHILGINDTFEINYKQLVGILLRIAKHREYNICMPKIRLLVNMSSLCTYMTTSIYDTHKVGNVQYKFRE